MLALEALEALCERMKFIQFFLLTKHPLMYPLRVYGVRVVHK